MRFITEFIHQLILGTRLDRKTKVILKHATFTESHVARLLAINQ